MSANPDSVGDSATLNVPKHILEDLLISFKNEEQTFEQIRLKLADYQTSESRKLADDQNVSKSELKSRTPLTKAKSFPDEKETLDDARRRRSHPEVFKFPDVSKHNQREPVIKESNTEQSLEHTESNSSKTSLQSSVSMDSEVKGHSGSSLGRQGPQGCEGQLADPVDEGFSSGSGGVSEIYFNNVINELVKTKQFLHNLQKQQSMFKEDKLKTDQLKDEIEQLKIQNQHLKGQLTRLNLVQEKMKFAQSQREESVEIKSEKCHMASQTDVGNEAERNEDAGRIEFLIKDNVNLRQELMDLNEHYNTLKNSVKVLSTCLQEEKRRIRHYEEQINKLGLEKKQVVEKLGKLRQQHELVQQEKHHLEKTLALSGSPDAPYVSPYSRSHADQYHSRHSSSGSHRSGGSGSPYASVVAVSPATNIGSMPPDRHIGVSSASPAGHIRSMTPVRQGSGHGMPTSAPFTLNNLSPKDPAERAPSNLPGVSMQPQRRYGLDQSDRANSAPSSYSAGHQYVSRSSDMSSNYELIMARAAAPDQGRVSSEPTNYPAMTDTQAHPTLECPNCYREFQVENSYLIHLQKCIE